MSEQSSPDLGLFPENDAVRRAQEIADERQGVSAAKMERLYEDPRVKTLLETGQVAVASVLFAEDRTGTTELPTVKPESTHKRVNRRGGRSINEGSDSEHDEYWNAPAPELTPEETANSKEQVKLLAEQMRLENAAKAYRAEVEQGDVTHALALLRARGFRPDPSTGGRTVIRIRP